MHALVLQWYFVWGAWNFKIRIKIFTVPVQVYKEICLCVTIQTCAVQMPFDLIDWKTDAVTSNSFTHHSFPECQSEPLHTPTIPAPVWWKWGWKQGIEVPQINPTTNGQNESKQTPKRKPKTAPILIQETGQKLRSWRLKKRAKKQSERRREASRAKRFKSLYAMAEVFFRRRGPFWWNKQGVISGTYILVSDRWASSHVAQTARPLQKTREGSGTPALPLNSFPPSAPES